MRIETIQEHTIILAPSYVHKQLRSELLEQTNAVANLSVMSVDTYLAGLLRHTYDAYIYQCYVKLQDMELTYFAGVKENTDFVNEVVSFVDDVHFYGIQDEQLKESDVYLKELKDIILTLKEVPCASKEQTLALQQIEDAKHILIMDDFASARHRYVYNILQSKGASIQPTKIAKPKKSFYYVLNKKEECEAVARYIIQHDIAAEQAKLTMCDESYQPFLEQVLDRYEIPHSFQSVKKKNRLIFSFTSLLAYYLQPDSEHLAALFETEVFISSKAEAFVSYVRSFNKTLDDDFDHIAHHVDETEHIIDEKTRLNFKQLELDAREVKIEVQETLEKLLACSLQEAVLYIEALLVEQSSFQTLEDVQTIRQIRTEIKIAYTYIDDKTVALFMERLEALQTKQTKEMVGMQIGSLSQPLKETDYHFVLGANASCFPGFAANSGLFSENYVKQTAYPSLEERYEMHVKQALASLQTSKHVLVFYATSGLDGKVQQPSLEIETFMDKPAKPYPLPFSMKSYTVDTNLDTNYGEALFKKDGAYHGSVSSFEMYTNCPYKYFLRHGLHIYEEAKSPFDSATTGTLMHYIYESLTRTFGKDYASASVHDVSQLIAKESEALAKLYVQDRARLQMSQARLLKSVLDNLAYLESFEQDNQLIPTEFEHRFDTVIPVGDEKVHLRGFIDRLDMNRDFISVIDYKSSAKKLDLKDVRKGIKLQLPTYLYVAHQNFARRPVGAYYYSFQNGKQGTQYAKLNRGKLECQDDQQRKENFEKSKKFVGWTTSTDFPVMDASESFIDGIGRKKDGTFSAATKIYKIEAVEQLLIANLERIVEQLRKAKIQIEPISCNYCKYQDICHNRKDGYDRDMLPVDQDIYIVGKLKEEESE